MKSRALRRVCVSVVTVAALSSVAACGGSDEAGGSGGKNGDRSPAAAAVAVSPIAALKKVQTKNDSVHSAKVESTMAMGAAMSMTMSGVMDWSDGMSGDVSIKYTGGTMGEAMAKMGGDGTMRALYLKDAYYMNMGDAFASALGGKHWLRYAYADLAALTGASGEAAQNQIKNSTPQEGVKALLASGDVKKVGEEDVRGVATTHYSGVVDVAALTAKSGGLDADQLQELKDQLDKAGLKTETVDVWVDKDDLLVKKTERGESAAGAVNTTIFYSDYGTPVSVRPPAAGDTADFKEIAGQAAKAAS
ncbi:LppX_LprAFG lipoprotein [Streptomyces sp. NPDC005576]|uniref:LppX_LprAFG lipoprotein n=1 Tax=unclassified Streptomyces TaxID=2593676 RepID=UPI0033DE26CC